MEIIGLQELIDQVKDELVGSTQARVGVRNPLFFVERVELEIGLTVTHTSDGSAKLAVLGFAEVGGGKTLDQEKVHVVKVSLLPLLSREELLKDVLQQPTAHEALQQQVSQLVKGIPLAGERD